MMKLYCILTFFIAQCCIAQFTNGGSIFVSKSTIFFVNSKTVFLRDDSSFFCESNFDNMNDNGLFVLGEDSEFSDTNSRGTFIDGMVEKIGAKSFEFPIGADKTIAPIKLSEVNQSVRSAFYKNSPSNFFSNNIDLGIAKISESEFWVIQGRGSANITLSWRVECNISVNDVIIVGYKNNKWEKISSIVDPISFVGNQSNNISGSITSIDKINLYEYEAFTLALKSKDFDNDLVFAKIENEELVITSLDVLSFVQLFDISGKLILDINKIGKEKIVSQFKNPQGIYIAKIGLKTGKIISKKLINLK